MRAVFKHKLELVPHQVVPFYLSDLVHIDQQNGELFAWFETATSVGQSTLHIAGTGQWEIEANWFHLTTVQLNGFVWHFYAEYELDND